MNSSTVGKLKLTKDRRKNWSAVSAARRPFQRSVERIRLLTTKIKGNEESRILASLEHGQAAETALRLNGFLHLNLSITGFNPIFKNISLFTKIALHKVLIIGLLVGFSFVQTAFAQGPQNQTSGLAVGDDAPELKIEKWLKGGGFNKLERGKVYLIDIWATWCAPCLSQIPHLSRLQQKYKDKNLEIIGITSEDSYGNSFEQVEKFVGQRDAAINYNLAWVPASTDKDGTRGIFVHPWMLQTGTTNMPTAFIVDKNGKFAFIGDPYTIDKPLEDIVNDRYDLSVLRTNYLEGLSAEKVMKQFVAAVKANNTNQAVIYGNQILTKFKYVKPNTFLSIGAEVSSIKGKIDDRLLEIAFRAAKQGIILTKFESSGFFDVLASIYAAKGDYFQAVNAEKLAISLSEGGMKESQIKNLERYLSLMAK